MKKLTAILSILLMVGLVGTAFAGDKKPSKTNFTPKKKHAMEAAATTKVAPAPVAPVVVPAPVVPVEPASPEPVASASPATT